MANEFNEMDETKRNRLPLIIGAAVAAVLVVGVGAWWFASRGSGGQAVPAPKNVSFDQKGDGDTAALPGEETLTIEPDQVARIGLKTEAVGETMAPAASEASAAGTIEANQYQSTPAIALAGGVVRRMNVELGQNVAKGQPVAVVFSSELADAQATYLRLRTDAETARQNLARASKLSGINQGGLNERDEALAKLKSAQAVVEEHHLHHARTIKLVEIGAVSREELEQTTTMLKTAEAELEQAKARYERAKSVATINPQGRGDLEQAQLRLQTSTSELAGARERLRLLGLADARIDALRNSSQIDSELVVTAPVSGTVTARAANAGEAVEANKEILRITNLSSVWAVAQVYEQDLAAMRVGTGASVTSDAYPDRIFRGQVTYVDPNINPETRTAQVRVELENPGNVLRIGQFVKVSFGALGNSEKTAPVVPASAVQNLRGGSVVFLATDKPNVFIMKPVRLAPEKDGGFPVIEGVKVGDKVVTEGSFLLRAEVLKRG